MENPSFPVKTIKLSKPCWDCLFALREVSYSTGFIYLLTDQIKFIQKSLRAALPDMKGDFFKISHEGHMISFSLSDGAILEYKDKIQNFSYFGAGVKFLGAYESYIKAVVNKILSKYPDDAILLKKNYSIDVNSKIKKYVSKGNGRGINLYKNYFGYDPHPSKEPSFELIYQLRNVSVHNDGIADEALVSASKNEHIHTDIEMKVGMKVFWSFPIIFQLYNLLTSTLTEVDDLISKKLQLEVFERKAFWFYGDIG